jgi:hypothetical protein
VTARETARAKARALRSRPSAAFPRFHEKQTGGIARLLAFKKDEERGEGKKITSL